MDAMGVTGRTVSAFRGAGTISGGNLALLPEYLQTLIGLSQQQLQTLGEVDQGINVRMIAGISALDEAFKNPDVLRGVVSSLQGGLTNASSPQVEALQYSVLSRANPGASLFELQKTRERGLSDPKYASMYLTQLRDVSGGSDERFYLNIASAFGMSASMAEKVGGRFAAGDIDSIIDLAGTGSAAGEIAGRAGRGRGTSEIEISTAKFTSQFQQTGKDLVDGMVKLSDNIKILFEGLDIFSKIGDAIETANKVNDEMDNKRDEIADKLEAAGKNFQAGATRMAEAWRYGARGF